MRQRESADPYAHLDAGAIKSLEANYLFSTYKRYDLVLSHGSGVHVTDIEGRTYLDFLAGIAVNSLGYNHPRLVKVLIEQGQRMIHCSNLYYHRYQGPLARKLVEISGMARVFFTNSGTEAIEGALKIARAHAHKRGGADKSVILTLKNSFHGRTLGALSITAQEKYQAPFRPLVPEVQIIEDFTVAALEREFSDKVCALVMEPIQGEAGVVPVPMEMLKAARRLCDRHEAVLIFDEIQCGMGRTGRYFAFQHFDIRPDLVTLAKSLAAGYPLGAILGGAKVADSLQPGEHGTTFGGGPLACRLALEVLDVIEQEGLLERVRESGDYLVRGLKHLAGRYGVIREVRGLGLMIGVEMGPAAKTVVERLMKRGVLANAAHDTVLRLLPPFIVKREDCDEFLTILDQVLSEIQADSPA